MIIGVLACIILPFTFSDDMQSKFATTTIKPFTSQTANFSIGCPTDWKASDVDAGGVMTTCTFSGPDGAKIIIMQLFTNDLKLDISKAIGKDSPLKAQHTTDVSLLKMRYKDFSASDTETSTIGASEAYVTKYKYKSTSGFIRRPMCGILVTTYNGPVPITIRMYCPERDFVAMQSLFQRCLETFTPSSNIQNKQ